jgi:hypothetical protein
VSEGNRTDMPDKPMEAGPVPLSVIVASGVQFEWYEGTAVVQELCALVGGPDRSASDLDPDPERILVHVDGTLSFSSSDRRAAQSAEAQVKALARLLLSLVSESMLPVRLRLLLLSTISGASLYPTVAAFSDALAYFERPRRRADICAVYLRWSTGPREPVQPGARPPEPVTVKAEEPSEPARPRNRRLPMVLGIVIVVLAGGTTVWWLSGRPAFQPFVTGSEAVTDLASHGWTATKDLVASGVALVQSRLGGSREQPSAGPPAEVVQSPEKSRARVTPGAKRPPGAAETEGPAPQPGAEVSVPVGVQPDLAALKAFDLSASVAGQPATGNLTLRPEPAATPPSPRGAGRPVVDSDVAAPIYSTADRDVDPPVPIQPKIPTALPAGERTEDLTVVDLIISDDGLVESVRLVRPVRGVRETMILSAVKAWRFEPALRNGQPVRYSKRFWLSLSSSGY